MLTVDQIVDALRTSRVEFGRYFMEAQLQMGIERKGLLEFEAIGTDADNKIAFRAALNKAKDKNFLLLLIIILANSELEDGTLASYLLQIVQKKRAELQAISNPPAGFTEPLIFGKLIIKFSQIAGKVVINGVDKGSGVLIGPHLFLTAWHVLYDLYDKTKNAEGKDEYFPKVPLPVKLEIEFNSILDEHNGAITPKDSFSVEAHRNWCVAFSICHPSELNENIPNPATNLNGYYDYVIIRLTKTVGNERRWINPDPRVHVPETNANIVLFQHPNGAPLRMDYSQIVDIQPPDPAVIPNLRFLHVLNTTKGSSGGPCFNKDFSLIGIHQGAWPDKINGRTANRGIPIENIIKHYRSVLASENLPSPDPADCPTWCLDLKNRTPVIGTDPFQSKIWESVMTDKPRLITIGGYEKTGKSFLVDLTISILKDADNLKIVLLAGKIANDEPVAIAQHVCSAAGAVIPDFVPFEKYNSTPPAWLRDEIVFKLLETLNAKRANRKVWICIKDLNQISINGKYATEFLLMLYEQVSANSWFRIVLDGMRAELPFSIKEFVYKHLTTPINQKDIDNYLQRGIRESSSGEIGSTNSWSSFLFNKYGEFLAKNPNTALTELAEESGRAMDALTSK